MSLISRIFNNLFRRHSIPILCSFVVFFISLLAYLQLKDYVQFRHERLFALKAEHAQDVIQNKIRDYAKLLNDAKAFYYTADTISKKKWSDYLKELRRDSDYPRDLSLGYISYLSDKTLAEHILKMRNSGETDYHVFPVGRRENYAVVDYLVPTDSINTYAIGYDLLSEPLRRDAIVRAMESGQLSITGKVKFVTDKSNSSFTGFLFLIPIYKTNLKPASPEEARRNIKAFIYCPFWSNYLADILNNKDLLDINLEIYEGEYMTRESLIMDSNHHNDLLDLTSKNMHKLLHIVVGGRIWNLYFSTKPGFGSTTDSNLPIIVLFGGFIIGILLFFVIYAYSSRQLESLILARKMTKSLRESEAQITNIFNNSPDAVIVINKDSRILKWNPKAEKIFGWKENEVAGNALTEIIIPHKYREAHKRGMAHFLASGEGPVINTTIEITALNKNQEEFDIELSISNTTENGSPIFIAFINDITERKKSQNTIEQKTKELESSNAELQQFASIASHDLKEPLRKILLFGDLLSNEYKETLPEDGQAYIERMQNAASRMQELIEDLLAFSRIGSKQEYFETVDLNVILFGIINDLEISIKQKNATIKIEDLPTLQAIPNQMRQLFQNLVSNALKFSRQDVPPVVKISYKIIPGSMIDQAPAKIKDHTFCEITVSDNGIGFDNMYADKIFVIFQRLHSRDTYEGTGIGLAICKKIAEYHNGFISAKSVPGKGTTFIITLPITV
jgi:two-component system sensor kinase FixL